MLHRQQRPDSDSRCRDYQVLDVEGWRVGMIHSLEGSFVPCPSCRLLPPRVDVMISGHTHEERLEHRDGVTLVNSGSITFPHHKELRLGTVGLLEFAPQSLSARVFPLGHTPGRPNPGRELSIENSARRGRRNHTMQIWRRLTRYDAASERHPKFSTSPAAWRDPSPLWSCPTSARRL